MSPVPAPTLILPREEWPDADFDLPDGVLLQAPDKDEDEDWDIDMNLGHTGGAKANAVVAGLAARSEISHSSHLITIRPPLQQPDSTLDDEDDEGVSTIKATGFPTLMRSKSAKPIVDSIDEDFEDAFALPSNMTQLSLAPLSHQSSKNSLEWGDKDNSSSSQSSDAYSTLGFAEASPTTNSSSSSVSLPDTETEEEDELEGLVLPSALFESGHSGRQLKKILEMKKKAHTNKPVKVSNLDPEDDFEMGLVINDDVDLSPSRLMHSAQQQTQRHFNRSISMPPQRPSTSRPPLKVTANTLQVSRQPTDIFCKTVTEASAVTVPTSSTSLSFSKFPSPCFEFSHPYPLAIFIS